MSGSSGPRRLLEHGDDLDGVLRNALQAERADEDLDAERMRKIERSIALAIGTAVPPSAPPPAANGGAPVSTAATWKWLVSAAGAAGLAVAVVLVTGEPSESRIAPAPRTPNTVVAAPTPLERASAAPPSVRPEDLPSAPVASPSTAPSARSAPKVETDEIALIAQAHDRLHASPAEALALCRDHEARFAGGHFAQEREAIAIEALVYVGRRSDAERRFHAFRDRYPSSSHRVHLESLFSH